MNTEEIKILFEQKFEIKCEEQFLKYLDLCQKPYDGVEYSEKHHILPKSLFPEFKNESWNLIKLKYDDHITAHIYLAKFTDLDKMKCALAFMKWSNVEDKINFLKSGYFKGSNNPACQPGVGEKISKAKTGKSRPDCKGKIYFGADPTTIKNGLEKMREKLIGTVIVKDKNNNRFRVSVNDPRYISGELVQFNLGVPNTREVTEQLRQNIKNGQKAYLNKISNFTEEELLNFLEESHNSGKKILQDKPGRFERNYSKYVNLTNYSYQIIYNKIVQRLSKDSLIS